MSCEPIKVHDEQQLLSQKTFQTACQSSAEDVPSDVMPQPLPCGEQSARSNLPIESYNKPLELLSQPLSSTTSRQDVLEDPEVLFLSVHSAMETEQNVADSRSNTDCQQKQGQLKGNCKRHIDATEDSKNEESTKRI